MTTTNPYLNFIERKINNIVNDGWGQESFEIGNNDYHLISLKENNFTINVRIIGRYNVGGRLRVFKSMKNKTSKEVIKYISKKLTK